MRFSPSAKWMGMSLALLATALLCLSPAQANSKQPLTIKVTGVGASLAEAQKLANRNAIQEAFGAIMVSERRITNDELYEDDVSYSRGIIEKSTLVRYHTDPKSRLIHADYEVTVSASTIERRLVHSADAKAVDGKSLGAKIMQGQQQADYEVERHLKARALLAHLLKGFPDSLFSTRSGKINTARSGYEFQTTMEVFAAVDERAVDSLMYAVAQYRDTRLPAVPEVYTQYGGLFEVNKPGFISEKSEYVQLDKALHTTLTNALTNMGMCLLFLDDKKSLITAQFVPMAIERGNDEGWASRLGVSVYFMNFLRNGNLEYRNRHGVMNRIGGEFTGTDGYGITYAKEIPYVVPFAKMSTEQLERLSEVASKITVKARCR